MQKGIGAAVVAAALVAGALAGPAAATHGAWMAYSGVLEPSTEWDTSDYMFQAPNQAAVEKVYFNGMIMSDALFKYDFQVEGGSVMAPTVVRFVAALGFWRDCNEDGYIGARVAPASYGSFSVYPRSLSAINETICPLGSPYNAINTATNNPNGQIDEFRWIGPLASYDPNNSPPPICVPPSGNPVRICPADTRVTRDRYDVTDDDAKVWADWAYPGGPHKLRQGITLDGSTAGDSDGTLGYVDAALEYRISDALGPAWTNKPNVGECGSPPAFLGGPSNGLPTGTCGVWPLYQAFRSVNDSQGNGDPADPLVTVFEYQSDDDGSGSPCDDGFRQSVAGTTVAIPDHAVGAHPNVLVQGSVVGTADNLWRGTNGAKFDGQCAPAGFSVGGSGDAGEDEPTHRQVDEELIFAPDQRYHILDTFGFEEMALDLAGARGTPQALTGVPSWTGGGSWTMRPPRSGWGSLVETYATFYADVTNAAVAPTGQPTNNPAADPATALPGAQQDKYVYGVEHCPSGITTGTSNVDPNTLWDCSKTIWDDKRIDDNQPDRPILGDPYDLRDTDCHDNTISQFTGDVRLGFADCSATHQ